MRAWHWVVVGLYVLILLLIYPVLALAALDIHLADAIKVGLFAWPALLLMGLCQWSLLRVPIAIERRRPVTRRPLLNTVVAAGFAFGLIVLGGGWCLAEFFKSEPLLWAAILLAVGSWVGWAIYFYRLGQRGLLDSTLSGIRRPLFRGSILEFLIAVPTHIAVRRRHECCAGEFTFFGLVTGVSVMLFAFGPAVYVLYVNRWRRLRPVTRDNPADDGNISGSLPVTKAGSSFADHTAYPPGGIAPVYSTKASAASRPLGKPPLHSAPAHSESPEARLERATKLRQIGQISEEEYQEIRRRILESL